MDNYNDTPNDDAGNSPDQSQQPDQKPDYYRSPIPSGVPPQKNKNMAIASMVVGIFALISCCCSPLGLTLSIIGIVLVILSKKGAPFSGFAVAGLVLSIIALLGSLFSFAYYMMVLSIAQDPQFGPMFNDMMQQYQEIMPTN